METYQPTSKSKSAQEAVDETMRWVQERRASPGVISGVSSWGFDTLDRWTGGVQPGELVGLGARPGVGKSAWLNVPIQTIARTFREAGRGQVVRGVILEMSVREFTLRQIAAMAMVHQGKVRVGAVDDAEYARMRAVALELRQLPLEYVDFNTPLQEIERFLRSPHRKTGWWFIDHLGIIPGIYGSGGNAAATIAGFMDELSRFARQIAPGLIVVPLNRNVEARQDQHPVLSDFNGSGQIEYNLQLALGLYRDMREALRPENRDRPFPGDLEVMKQRNGPLGRIYMLYDAPRTLWYEDEARNAGRF
jgi:replicative DNA helicase